MHPRRILAAGIGIALAALLPVPTASAVTVDGLTFDIGLGRGTVQDDGTVAVAVTYTCNELVDGLDTFVGIGLRQTRGPHTARAGGWLDGGFVCDGETHERTFVSLASEDRFRGGPATASLWVNACGFDPRCVQYTAEETVKLR